MQTRIFLSPPWVGEAERAAVAAAFDSGYVAPCGPMVDAFDARLGQLASCSAAAVASGTAAMDLLMEEFAVNADTTVITSSLTFIATVGPAVHHGARPVFIDSDPTTGTMSVPLLEEALRTCATRHTVILAADIYGQCCDYRAISELCDRYGATLIIDAAEAVGATCYGRPAGSAGMAAIYSFNGNKLITTSGGGAVLSHDTELVARARWRAQQAREATIHYEHREVGFNYRLSNLLAAVGCAQLDRLDEIVRRKRAIFAFYRDFFEQTRPGEVTPFPCGGFTESTHWLSVFLFPSTAERDKVSASLAAADIESRPVWKPLHLQPAFNGCRTFGGQASAELFAHGLCLPSGASLTPHDLDRIAATIAQR